GIPTTRQDRLAGIDNLDGLLGDRRSVGTGRGGGGDPHDPRSARPGRQSLRHRRCLRVGGERGTGRQGAARATRRRLHRDQSRQLRSAAGRGPRLHVAAARRALLRRQPRPDEDRRDRSLPVPHRRLAGSHHLPGGVRAIGGTGQDPRLWDLDQLAGGGPGVQSRREVRGDPAQLQPAESGRGGRPPTVVRGERHRHADPRPDRAGGAGGQIHARHTLRRYCARRVERGYRARSVSISSWSDRADPLPGPPRAHAGAGRAPVGTGKSGGHLRHPRRERCRPDDRQRGRRRRRVDSGRTGATGDDLRWMV
ncbi:MAG: Oxidoreductase, aldo/keto reductase family, partial [uncultured Thermomicrobiales bacterium]